MILIVFYKCIKIIRSPTKVDMQLKKKSKPHTDHLESYNNIFN